MMSRMTTSPPATQRGHLPRDAAEDHARQEEPDEEQEPARDQRQRAILSAQGEIEREQSAGPADRDQRQPREGGGEPRVDHRDRDQRQLRRDPQEHDHAHEPVPEAQAQERVEEDHEARRERGLGGGAVHAVSSGRSWNSLWKKPKSMQR